MHVYVVEFAKHPGLFKIGVTKDIRQRLPQLKATYGLPLNTRWYEVGSRYKKVEQSLHKAFSPYRKPVPGVGGTEFFDVTIRPDVERIINEEIDRV